MADKEVRLIDKDKLIKKINAEIDAWAKPRMCMTADELLETIEEFEEEAAPVKQWYSVEENQPDSVGDDVLVVDSYGKYHIAYYLSWSENWMNQDTREPIKDVVKWRYLDGDSK